MKTTDVPTFWARIFIAGNLATIKETCQAYCDEVGLCVTVERSHYIYTDGDEHGAAIGLINYPRFPSTPEEIFERAEKLAFRIMDECDQKSFSIMTPAFTRWYNDRGVE
jgi:hypothetical protein